MLNKIDFSSFRTIIFVGLIFRLLSAIFSAGYGMHDDHFLIVEAASSWADGFDYNGWLPWSEGNRGGAEGHSFTYVGINYIYFAVAKFLGMDNPMTLMLFNRILHALASITVVYFGIKITEKISNRKNAVIVGWILSLLWIMPFLSVRNLVEMTSIPFLMWGVWLLVRNRKPIDFLYAGMLLGMAVSFRYQIGVFAVGLAAYYFFKYQWKPFFLFCGGVLLVFGITQGLVDFLIWGYPFAEFIAYFTYNVNEGVSYMINTNYFMYFYVLFGVLLFPLGVLALIGFFNTAKKQWFLFLPTIVFILFHSFYPNRQERFILTVFPIVVILSIIGIDYLRKSAFWNKAWNFSWKAFWVLNIPLLLFFSFTSSKKSRIEAMYALYDNGMQKEHILVEASGDSKISMMPKFYSKSWEAQFRERDEPVVPLLAEKESSYDYIFFIGDDKLQDRINLYKPFYPNMKLEKKCQPSAIDIVLHKLNPRNSNEYIEVWKTNL
jgi:hypothetical protein|tara:strand:- start:14762 stop:16234 length:1473 start_codon:yes stop_codon:yes gene_type:complete